MKDVVILKCKECGEEFLYEWSGRGKKPNYCQKCKQIVIQRSKQKYNDKQKSMKNLKVEEENAEISDTYEDFVDRILTTLGRLDTIRVELCNIATELNQYQSSYDKNDQFYMHSLENVDINNATEIQEFVKSWKASRNNRRNVKDLITVVAEAIDKIPYKNLANAMPLLKGENYMRRQTNDTRRTNLYVKK